MADIPLSSIQSVTTLFWQMQAEIQQLANNSRRLHEELNAEYQARQGRAKVPRQPKTQPTQK